MNSDLILNKLITIIILAIIIIMVISIIIIPVIRLIWGWLKNIFRNKNTSPVKSIPNNDIVTLELEKTEKKKINYINEHFHQKSRHDSEGGSTYIVISKDIIHYSPTFLTKLLNWDKICFQIKFKPYLRK